MIKAIVRNGTIQPLEPIPPEWHEGREVVVQEADIAKTPPEIDQWYRELEALCAESDPADDERLREALTQAHEQAKAMVRQQMGHE
jgi:hypothetical protein